VTDLLLLRLHVGAESDVFLLRQRGREVAAEVGMDAQNQIRVATALSDLGRDLLGRRDHRVVVEFHLQAHPRPALRIQFEWSDPGHGGDPRGGVGWLSASRLMTEVRAGGSGDRRTVTLLRSLPMATPPATGEYVARLRTRLAVLVRRSALDELRSQNEELLVTLEALERKQGELIRLNAELEETNRGVMALYGELSDELEETNRGVVALYAELDDKSTQLREAAEARTRFWANISHELRAPVNSVIGLTRLLMAADADPLTDEQRHQVEMINDSGHTLLALVNELLDTAKAESGRLQPQPQVVDLPALFAQLRGTMRPGVVSAEVALVIDEPRTEPPLVTDETMLGRILRNLLSNGLKFTERGEVRLHAALDEEGGHWEFLVTDTGIGIPREHQRRVFEEFHQVPNELQNRTSGTGLGLPYARRLAEILDGTLELRSTPGEGTEVRLRLPAVPSDGAAQWGHVLLVDDDEVFRAGFRDLIGDLAGVVSEASDGRAALRVAADEPPDLVVLDLHMPGMDGYDCLAALRGDPRLADIPVVVVTAADRAGIDSAALGSGVAVLQKAGLSRTVIQDGVRRARQATRGQGAT
jgi:signal transduction histidine kinase/CheY-like chemotaxis protein